jgi:hypothetical protein
MHTYVAVAKDTEARLRERLGPNDCKIKQRIVIGESLIFHLIPLRTMFTVALEKWLIDEAIAFNLTEHHDIVSYWPDSVLAMRYDHQGNQLYISHLGNEPEGLRDVLHHLITIEPNDPRDKDRLFHAYLLCIGFEDQERLGKLHLMRKLVGGL